MSWRKLSSFGMLQGASFAIGVLAASAGYVVPGMAAISVAAFWAGVTFRGIVDGTES